MVFETSGDRGAPLRLGFDEAHALTIARAICLSCRIHGITGPLFLGRDTHALSEPARLSAAFCDGQGEG